ncbi:MAG: hypothetical protein RSF40_12105, partial [Oscillospiraceae bacterium]
MSTKYNISDEQLAAFIDGSNSAEVIEAMGSSEKLFKKFRIASIAANLVGDDNEQSSETWMPPVAPQPAVVNIDFCCAVTENCSDEQNDICVIRSEQLILEGFGIEASIEELIELSSRSGWYVSGRGTAIGCLGNILEHYGLQTERRHGGSIEDIRSELLSGSKVMLCVDSDELIGDRGAQYYEDVFVGEIPDHTVVVAKISPDGEVVIHDPATAGQTDSYPLEQLLDAWA